MSEPGTPEGSPSGAPNAAREVRPSWRRDADHGLAPFSLASNLQHRDVLLHKGSARLAATHSRRARVEQPPSRNILLAGVLEPRQPSPVRYAPVESTVRVCPGGLFYA